MPTVNSSKNQNISPDMKSLSLYPYLWKEEIEPRLKFTEEDKENEDKNCKEWKGRNSGFAISLIKAEENSENFGDVRDSPFTQNQISTYDTRPEKLLDNQDDSKETARKERFKGQAVPLPTESSPHCSSEWYYDYVESSIDESLDQHEEIVQTEELSMVQNWINRDHNAEQESRAMGTIKELSEEHVTESTPRTSHLKSFNYSFYESTKAKPTSAYCRNDAKFITNLNNMGKNKESEESESIVSKNSMPAKFLSDSPEKFLKFLKPTDLESEADITNNGYFITNSDFRDHQSPFNGTSNYEKKFIDHSVTEESKIGNIKWISPQFTKSQWSLTSSNYIRYNPQTTESSYLGHNDNNAVLRTETDVQGDQVYDNFNDYITHLNSSKKNDWLLTPQCISKQALIVGMKGLRHQVNCQTQSSKEYN